MGHLLLWNVAALPLLATALIVDTHVHNANLSLGIAYTFPTLFPDLNRSWTMRDYAAETTNVGAVEAVLMTLEKSPNTYAQNYAEAQLYQSAVDDGSALAFVGGIALDDGPDDAAKLQAAFPGLVGLREGLWERPSAFFRNATTARRRRRQEIGAWRRGVAAIRRRDAAATWCRDVGAATSPRSGAATSPIAALRAGGDAPGYRGARPPVRRAHPRAAARRSRRARGGGAGHEIQFESCWLPAAAQRERHGHLGGRIPAPRGASQYVR